MDFYAGSSGVKQRLESALLRELHYPVKIGGLHYTLWSGLRATDITVAFPDSKGAGLDSLSVPSVSAKVAFGPLFSGRVIVEKLLFKEPSLVWMEGEIGGAPPSEEQLTVAPEVSGAQAKPESVSELGVGKLPEAVSVTVKKKTQRVELDFRIQTAQIQNATLRFLDRSGKEVCLLEGVDARSTIEAPNKASGNLSILKASFGERLILETFNAPFVFHDGALALPRIDTRLAGGSVRGEGTLAILPEHPPITLDLVFDDVSLEDLLIQLGEAQTVQQMSGTLQGNLDLYGRIGETKSFGGTAQLRLRDGCMEQFPLLQLIGKVLPIEELKHLDMRQAQLDMRVEEGRALIDSLVMESANLSLTANGTGGFDGKLNLAARLAVNPKVGRQLLGWVDANFQPVPNSDRRDIGFAVTGTLLAPETDLMRVMLGQRYGNQILNLWQSLTGKPKKKSGDKKKIEVTPSLGTGGEDATAHPTSTP